MFLTNDGWRRPRDCSRSISPLGDRNPVIEGSQDRTRQAGSPGIPRDKVADRGPVQSRRSTMVKSRCTGTGPPIVMGAPGVIGGSGSRPTATGRAVPFNDLPIPMLNNYRGHCFPPLSSRDAPHLRRPTANSTGCGGGARARSVHVARSGAPWPRLPSSGDGVASRPVILAPPPRGQERREAAASRSSTSIGYYGGTWIAALSTSRPGSLRAHLTPQLWTRPRPVS